MSRIRLPLRRSALFLLLVVLMLAATWPLSSAIALLALDARGLTASSARGSAWSGQLMDARLGVIDLGSPATSLSLPNLFIGEAKLVMDAPDGAPFRGEIIGTRNGVGLDDVDARIALADFGLPYGGAITLTDFSARFEDGVCVHAAGEVSSDVLTASAADYGVPAVPLAGVPECDGDRVILPLTGVSGPMRGELRIGITMGGTASGTLLLSGVAQNLQQVLQDNGFRPEERGLRLTF